MNKSVVLISQIQRSGGTLLSQLFDGHSQVMAYPRECELFKGGWPNYILLRYLISVFNSLSSLFPEYLKSKSIFEKDDFFWRKFKEDGYQKFGTKKSERYISFDFDFAARNSAFKKLLNGKLLPNDEAILNAFFQSFFSGWSEYKDFDKADKKVITAFSPGFCHGSLKYNKQDKFFSTFKDGHIISIIRDPNSWVKSAKKHSKKYNNDPLVKYYIPHLKAALTYKDIFPNQVTLIDFSDLVNNTNRVMRSISERINIDFDETLLIPTFNSEKIQSNSSFSQSAGKVIGNSRQNNSETNLMNENGIEEALSLYKYALSKS